MNSSAPRPRAAPGGAASSAASRPAWPPTCPGRPTEAPASGPAGRRAPAGEHALMSEWTLASRPGDGGGHLFHRCSLVEQAAGSQPSRASFVSWVVATGCLVNAHMKHLADERRRFQVSNSEVGCTSFCGRLHQRRSWARVGACPGWLVKAARLMTMDHQPRRNDLSCQSVFGVIERSAREPAVQFSVQVGKQDPLHDGHGRGDE